MELPNDADVLLDHFEHYLGNMESSFRAKKDGDFPFMVLVYPPKPSGADSILMTCGLSAHRLYVPSENRTTRIELGIFAREGPSKAVLNALLTAVALHLLETHESPGRHGILPGEGPVLAGGNPSFESFYLRPPVGLPDGFASCGDLSSPIEILQLIPITSGEERLIANAGWCAFEQAVLAQQIDLLSFDTRREAAY